MTAEIERLALSLLAGGLLGVASLVTLRLNTALYCGGRGVIAPIVLHFARLAIVSATLVWAAKLGADILVAAAAGLVLVRPIAMKALARRTA